MVPGQRETRHKVSFETLPQLFRELALILFTHNLRFFKLLFVIVWFTIRVAYRSVASITWTMARKFGYGGDLATLGEGWKARGGPDEYDDAEDEDFNPEEYSSSSSEDERGDDEENDDDGVGPSSLVEDDLTPAALYTDLSLPLDSTTLSTQDDYTPVLLAHHLAPSGSPLTRRRYSTLLNQGHGFGAGGESFTSALEQRRRETSVTNAQGLFDAKGREQQQRMCVVCTYEERTIICWPCRCLSLCEDCRDNLAERTLSSAHLCPTCRTPVKGFSRIVSSIFSRLLPIY